VYWDLSKQVSNSESLFSASESIACNHPAVLVCSRFDAVLCTAVIFKTLLHIVFWWYMFVAAVLGIFSGQILLFSIELLTIITVVQIVIIYLLLCYTFLYYRQTNTDLITCCTCIFLQHIVVTSLYYFVTKTLPDKLAENKSIAMLLSWCKTQ